MDDVASCMTGMHLWMLKYGAFLYVAQKKFCRRLIVVPLSTFHRLADSIAEPRGELSFLFHQPRAGSTLLLQVCIGIVHVLLFASLLVGTFRAFLPCRE